MRPQPIQTMADLIPPHIRWAVISAADEDLPKIARLKEQGILSEAEFNQIIIRFFAQGILAMERPPLKLITYCGHRNTHTTIRIVLKMQRDILYCILLKTIL